MRLSSKAVRFVLEALDHYQKYQRDQLSQPDLSDDDASDLENDRLYLEAIKQDFEKYQVELAGRRESVAADA